MFKRPSTRRRSAPNEVTLNLVPMLDALVTMIAFLMYTMAFLALTMVESPLPMASTEQNLQQLKDRPVQLTITFNDNDVKLWSPFERVKTEIIKNREDGTIDELKLHEILIAIKQKYPEENKVVLMPQKDTDYNTIVSVIDAAKHIDKTDPIIVVKNKETGIDEPLTFLFTEVVFGNLLSSD